MAELKLGFPDAAYDLTGVEVEINEIVNASVIWVLEVFLVMKEESIIHYSMSANICYLMFYCIEFGDNIFDII